MKIVGHTVGIPMPRTDYTQEDPTRSDYLKGRDQLNRKLEEALQAAQNAASGTLSKTGGTMEGALAMDGHPITGLPDPAAGDGAATKAYTDAQVKRAAPRNLLDNSDFTNAVNQRGVTGGDFSWAYTIDRWMANGNGFAFDGSGATVPAGGALVQRVPAEYASLEYVTFAVTLADGTVLLTTGDTTQDGIRLQVDSSDYFECRIENNTAAPVVLQNAALYAGEYAEDTLPAYRPKGYGAELAECQRYYLHRLRNGYGNANTTNTYIAMTIPAKMRIRPTLIFSEAGSVYCGGKKITVKSQVYAEMNDQAIIAQMTYDQISTTAHPCFWTGVCSASADL